MRGFLMALLFLSSGCAASVNVEALDGGFGLGVSAIRIHSKGSDADRDSVAISNVGGLCTKFQDYYTALNELTDAGSDITSSHYCENVEEPLTNFVDASQSLFTKHAHFLTLSVGDGFDEDKFDTPTEAGGDLMEVTNVPLEDALDDFDVDGSVLDSCGLDSSFLDEDIGDYWSIGDGTLEITKEESDGVVVGKLDAALKDEDDKTDGDILASFTATFCEVDPGD